MHKQETFAKATITILVISCLTTACNAVTLDSTMQSDKATGYFQYYNAVKLGMTVDEVNQTPGLAPVGFTDGTSCGYEGDSGFGVLVLFNGDGKVYSKILSFNLKVDLSPLTPMPVTQAQCDQIRKGMAHADVVELLGQDGVECSLASFKNDCTKMNYHELYWFNADGTALSVYFDQNNTVMMHFSASITIRLIRKTESSLVTHNPTGI